MKNTLPAASGVRQPRGIVTLNGTRVDAWEGWSVETNGFYKSDTFRVVLSTSKLAARGFGPDWMASQGQIQVEVFAGFPADPSSYQASDLESLIIGNVDDLQVDWRGSCVDLSGRDLSGALIDSKTSQKWPNLTASQIVTQIAGQYGLIPKVQATTTKVGRYYQIDNVRLQDDRPVWDLLTWLAREEQFVVYVKGKELHFEPPPQAAQDPYVFQWVPGQNGGPPKGNFDRLRTARTLTLAKDIKVVVRSWNQKQKKAFSKTATRSHKGTGANVQTYTFNIANLTPEQAQARANQLLAEITKHEMKALVEGPAENPSSLGIADVIQIQGTGTAWDQTYYPDVISRSMSMEDGYRWAVQMKNHNVDSTVTP